MLEDKAGVEPAQEDVARTTGRGRMVGGQVEVGRGQEGPRGYTGPVAAHAAQTVRTVRAHTVLPTQMILYNYIGSINKHKNK